MVKVLHAADFHLDSAFGALGEERARQRRQECRAAVGRLVDYGNDHGADLLLLSGDLFDGQRLYAETAELLAAELGRFHGGVVIAPGNHDPYGARSPYARIQWPGNVHIFTKDTVEAVAFPLLHCVVYGAAFTAAESGEPAAFRAEQEEVSLLVLHGEVGAAGSRYRPISREWLAESGVDYAALGHVHEFRGVERSGQTAWAYAGCPEGRGFDEPGEKGFLFGTVDKGRAEMEFVPFSRRRYAVLEADISEGDVWEQCAAALRGHEEDICRLVLRGEVDELPQTERLEAQLRPLCWEVQVVSRCRLRQSLWQGCGEDSLRGLFLQELRGQYDAAQTEEARAAIERAVRFGLAAMEDRDV